MTERGGGSRLSLTVRIRGRASLKDSQPTSTRVKVIDRGDGSFMCEYKPWCAPRLRPGSDKALRDQLATCRRDFAFASCCVSLTSLLTCCTHAAVALRAGISLCAPCTALCCPYLC
jgi:hypothetical protein